MRYAEHDGELHRLFAVLKMRFSNFDRALRVSNIRDDIGIQIDGSAPRAEGLPPGLARRLDPPAAVSETSHGGGEG